MCICGHLFRNTPADLKLFCPSDVLWCESVPNSDTSFPTGFLGFFLVLLHGPFVHHPSDEQ